MGNSFQRMCGAGALAGRTLRLALHAALSPLVSLSLAAGFFRHPLAVLSNVRHCFTKKRDAFDGDLFGVPDREAFVKLVRATAGAHAAGEIGEKPRLWLLMAYCQKPANCACGSAVAAVAKKVAQRRFNPDCAWRRSPAATSCGGGDCVIGPQWRSRGGEYANLRVDVRVMLDERMMSRLWDSMLDFQSRSGLPQFFVMDVCPFALWVAKRSLFHLKTPVGVAFHLRHGERCESFGEYCRADRGDKRPLGSTRLTGRGVAEREGLLSSVLAGYKKEPGDTYQSENTSPSFPQSMS